MATQGAELESQLWLTDKRGGKLRVVWLADDWLWRFRVFDRAKFVAEAKCLLQGSDLKLADLEVFKKARFPFRNWAHWFVRKVIGDWNSDYRNRGIGSALLCLIIELAKERQVTLLYGDLGPRDLQANPELRYWYRRRGFEVIEGGDFGLGRVRLILAKLPTRPC